MSKATTIAAILRSDMPMLTSEMPIRRAVALLLRDGFSAAPVIDDNTGTLQGMLSQKDCFRAALNASYYQEWKGIVADYMSCNVVALPMNTDLTTAAEAFLSHPHRSFPVLDGERLVGLLRRSDVLRAIVSQG